MSAKILVVLFGCLLVAHYALALSESGSGSSSKAPKKGIKEKLAALGIKVSDKTVHEVLKSFKSEVVEVAKKLEKDDKHAVGLEKGPFNGDNKLKGKPKVVIAGIPHFDSALETKSVAFANAHSKVPIVLIHHKDGHSSSSSRKESGKGSGSGSSHAPASKPSKSSGSGSKHLFLEVDEALLGPSVSGTSQHGKKSAQHSTHTSVGQASPLEVSPNHKTINGLKNNNLFVLDSHLAITHSGDLKAIFKTKGGSEESSGQHSHKSSSGHGSSGRGSGSGSSHSKK